MKYGIQHLQFIFYFGLAGPMTWKLLGLGTGTVGRERAESCEEKLQDEAWATDVKRNG